MRFVPTRIHGAADYIVGLILIVAPYVLGFADGSAAQYIPQALGLAALIYSPLTRYEWGLVGWISMPIHLWLDLLSGILLLASPWLFGFAGRLYWPHVVLGLIEIAASLSTKAQPGRSVRAP